MINHRRNVWILQRDEFVEPIKREFGDHVAAASRYYEFWGKGANGDDGALLGFWEKVEESLGGEIRSFYVYLLRWLNKYV